MKQTNARLIGQTATSTFYYGIFTTSFDTGAFNGIAFDPDGTIFKEVASSPSVEASAVAQMDQNSIPRVALRLCLKVCVSPPTPCQYIPILYFVPVLYLTMI